jgi:hypothetical protein
MKMNLGLCRTGFSAPSPESSQGLMLWADSGKNDQSADVSRISHMDQYLDGAVAKFDPQARCGFPEPERVFPNTSDKPVHSGISLAETGWTGQEAQDQVCPRVLSRCRPAEQTTDIHR